MNELLYGCPRCVRGPFNARKLMNHLVEDHYVSSSTVITVAGEAKPWEESPEPVPVVSGESPVPSMPVSAVGKNGGQPTALPLVDEYAQTLDQLRPIRFPKPKPKQASKLAKKKETAVKTAKTATPECGYCKRPHDDHHAWCKRQRCKTCEQGKNCFHHRSGRTARPTAQAPLPKGITDAVKDAETNLLRRKLEEERTKLQAELGTINRLLARLE